MTERAQKSDWLTGTFWGLTGICVVLVSYRFGDTFGGLGLTVRAVRGAFNKVGIVIIGLLPLAIWAVRLIWKQISGYRADAKMEMDYAYIARSATVLGLLGTITSLGIATSRLAGDVSAGSSSAILKVIPLTGQALVSTMVGLVIALAAETALHFIERRQESECKD